LSSLFSRALTGCLILSLVQPPTALQAEAASGWHTKRTPPAPPLPEGERALHALNRRTLGPRPGYLDRVQAVGVKKWIETQLNPEQIDDSLLEARLQSFPAMHLSQANLVQSFPSG